MLPLRLKVQKHQPAGRVGSEEAGPEVLLWVTVGMSHTAPQSLDSPETQFTA